MSEESDHAGEIAPQSIEHALDQREVAGEPVADVLAKSSQLKGVELSGDIVPLLIDEIPVIAVAAALADGTTTIRDAAELRVKESDRISASVSWMKGAGIDVTATGDGMVVITPFAD